MTSEVKETSMAISETAVEVWTNILDTKNPIKVVTVIVDTSGHWVAASYNTLEIEHYFQTVENWIYLNYATKFF
jgi:hypothetical protein